MFSLFRSATIYFLYKKFKKQIIFVCAYLIFLYLINSIIDDSINIYTYSNSHQIGLLFIKWSINILSFIFIIYKMKNMNLKEIIMAGENIKVEFKESYYQIPGKAYNSICSFLNT